MHAGRLGWLLLKEGLRQSHRGASDAPCGSEVAGAHAGGPTAERLGAGAARRSRGGPCEGDVLVQASENAPLGGNARGPEPFGGSKWLLKGGSAPEDPDGRHRVDGGGRPHLPAVGVACQKGLGKSCPCNQDSWLVYSPDGRLAIYGVFDGHGPYGHDISSFAKETLADLLGQDARLWAGEAPAALREAFPEMQQRILAEWARERVGAWRSGTTATVAVHDREAGTVVVANCGDSRCCLGSCSGPSRELTGVRALTIDHRPGDDGERQRIESAGASVVLGTGNCHRVALPSSKSKRRGLNMSRSLGDIEYHLTAGVVAEPTVTEVRLDPADRVLLLCSDGVWDFVSSAEAASVVLDAEALGAELAAQRLASLARGRWLAENWEGGPLVDDITAMVIFLDNRGSAPPLQAPRQRVPLRELAGPQPQVGAGGCHLEGCMPAGTDDYKCK